MKTIDEILMHYHGIDEEIEEGSRRVVTTKLSPTSIMYLDAVTNVLRMKRQEAFDTLICIGYEALCEADPNLRDELLKVKEFYEENPN